MGVFDSIERKLEGVVSGGFARAFKGDVQPVEITARLERELDSQARLLSRDRRLVPNEFTIGLSQHDFDNLYPYSKTINGEIVPQLRDYAADQGYVFNGPIAIEYVLAQGLPTGRFTVESNAAAPMTAEAGPHAPRRATLVLEVNGLRHPLVAPGFTLGRGADADIRINDPGISRLHARVLVSGSPTDPEITIEDMGSTNGIIVDGQHVERAVLREGARIEMGNTRLLVRTPVHDV